MSQYINISAYKFVHLDNLAERREQLLTQCQELGLKGTILLSHEGINLFVAGTRSAIDTFVADLDATDEYSNLPVKESISDHQPFNRMLVRLKKEIIAFGVEGVDPVSYTSRKIKPTELKKWLDEDKPVTLYDVRNDYEIELGTFEKALPAKVDNFRDFPQAVRELPSDLKEKPIVMFCTGGIRCEKAGPFMEAEGFQEIYQLDGGILKYFEECGGDHYDGDCFVFDQRVAVDSDLNETDTALCFACQAPVSPEAQSSEEYVPGISCPRCFKQPDQKQRELIERRHAQLACVATELPGSVPYDNVRPLNVPQRFDHLPLIEFLDQFHPHVGRDVWEDSINSGRITYKRQPVRPQKTVRAGERYDHLTPATVEPNVNGDIEILYEDDSIVVVNKPAPLPMHASGRFQRNTLNYLLDQVYTPLRLRVAHRLDANTTGIVVLSKTRTIAAKVQPQFEDGTVKKRYIAKIHGHPTSDEFICDAAIGTEASAGGGRDIDSEGLHAETLFKVLARLSDNTSLVEAQPITGRTNQIRLHLWHLGHSILGDPIYLPEGKRGSTQTLPVDADPMCLHAASISFAHPEDDRNIQFEAPLPTWAQTT